MGKTKKLRVSVQNDKLLLNLSSFFSLSRFNSQVYSTCADLQRLHPHLNTKKNLYIKIEKKAKLQINHPHFFSPFYKITFITRDTLNGTSKYFCTRKKHQKNKTLTSNVLYTLKNDFSL